jgi:hypothetical protein
MERGSMRSFYYRQGRSAFAAVFMAALAIAVGRMWRVDGGFVLLAFAVVMTLGAAKASLDAMNTKPALKFDRHALWIRKAWGGVEEVPWRDVHDIAIKMFTVRYMGVVPVRRHVYITITCEGGTFGARRFRVSTTAMGMSPTEGAAVVAALKQAQIEAIGEAGAAMAAAGSRGWGVDMSPKASEHGFDADAAMARYLASKQAEEPTPAAAPLTARPAMPQRPSFGRRVS